MKYALALLALLAFSTAHAAHWEIGAGMAHANTQGNGTWYQRGLPHTLRLNTPVLDVGFTGTWTRRIDWHLDAVYLGRVGVGSLDVPDANYSLSGLDCVGQCMRLQHFTGSGTVYGVQAMIDRHTTGSWQLGVEGGPFLYHASWALSVPDWYPSSGLTETAAPYPISRYNGAWSLGWTAGVTLAHGPWQAALQYYADAQQFAGYAGGDPTLWRGQFAALIGFRF